MPVNHHSWDYDAAVPAGKPCAIGDRYYSQDLARDFWHNKESVGQIMDDLYVAPAIISGGVVTKGAGDTLNITACVGVASYDTQIPLSYASFPPTTQTVTIKVRIASTAQTNMAIPSAVLNGSTVNYVKLKYSESAGSTRARARLAGTYVYEKVPSFTIVVDSAANTAYDVLLNTFTGTAGGAFTFSGTKKSKTITHTLQGTSDNAIIGCARCFGVYGYSSCCYGVYGCAACCHGGYFVGACGYGISSTTSCSIATYSCAAVDYASCNVATRCYGVYGYAGCDRGGHFVAVCCFGVSSSAGSCYGVYSNTTCDRGVYSDVGRCIAVFGGAACCYGGYFTGACGYGVYGGATACYGVYGYTGCACAVAGNGAYSNESSYYLKYKEPVCVTECLKKNPLKVYKYIWEDANQKGFDQFISPVAEDIQHTFQLTQNNAAMYTVDGIALGLGIELLERIEAIEKRLSIVEGS